MDATSPVREFLRSAGIHDFKTQPQGKEHKKLIPTTVVTAHGVYTTQTSIYRPTTKDGDPRIWVYSLGNWANGNNVLALVSRGDGGLLVINASSPGLIPGLWRDTRQPDVNILRILDPLSQRPNPAATELLGMIKDISGQWHQGLPGLRRDLEVGRLLEELLGLPANSSKSPDYKGIEIKAGRIRSTNRQTLFAKVPDWSISPVKSSAELVDIFGYSRGEKYRRRLCCSVSGAKPNSQGLYLEVVETPHRLAERSNKLDYPDVAYWPMDALKETLLAKHPETFWVRANCIKNGASELFRYEKVLHTKRPIASALPTLLETGAVTVDHLITRDHAGRVRERGPLFRIDKRNFDLLFPPGEEHDLR
ncbi:hypothetical protein Psesu_2197 [Pseudoxanthomonas suwonensis 11-1]|uniref:MvaI/BcnI restriction endonuclease domain-containing protein n=1 Tax=Pseudoxanthomonas suwonensis (strain 11-1) TaxID=743721 RepID=E6WV33_PSEUU|nr:MvaI/BcnI restriction endonuclease family protein [Pseudoxanthomonas suwonensis]ADV28032.1 hypothetical protein Psesu_2197 [Pseudoxanthomonas suwonensis 11-1]